MSGAEQALRRIVDRLGVERLSRDATLARTGLKDLFPDDPLIVAVLTAAVDNGALTALARQGGPAPLGVVGPRLAAELGRTTGLSDSRAQWAIAAWAVAIGASNLPLPVLPRDGREPDMESFFADWVDQIDDEPTTVRRTAHHSATDLDGEGRVTSGATGAASNPGPGPIDDDDPMERATTLRLPAVPPPDETPTIPSPRHPEPVRRRPRVPVVAGAVVLALVATTAVTAFLLRPQAAFAAHGSTAGAKVADGTGTAALTSGEDLQDGATVTTGDAPVELRRGDAVIRLDQRTALRADDARSVTLLDGRAYVQAAGDPLTVRTGADSTTAQRARAIFDCTGEGCVTTSLGEHLEVRRGGGASATMTTLTRATADGERSFLVPDLERKDAWFSRNDRLDREQERSLKGLPGVSLTGTDWVVDQRRSDLPSNLSTYIRFEQVCAEAECTMLAKTRMDDTRPHEPDLEGAVRASDGSGTRFTINYTYNAKENSPSSGRTPRVLCSYDPGQPGGTDPDGSETVLDRLTVRERDGSPLLRGVRVTKYTSDGQRCTGPEYAGEKTTELIDGRRGTLESLTDDEQQALLNYVASSGNGCASVKTAPRSSLVSDVRCSYAARGDDATSLELAAYKIVKGEKQVIPAYRSAIAKLGSVASSDCDAGPCETAIPGGRLRLATDGSGAVLVSYDTRTANTLVILRGPSVAGLYTWWKTQKVYTVAPIPRVGI